MVSNCLGTLGRAKEPVEFTFGTPLKAEWSTSNLRSNSEETTRQRAGSALSLYTYLKLIEYVSDLRIAPEV